MQWPIDDRADGERRDPVTFGAVRLYRESEPKPVIRRLAEQLNVAGAENLIRPLVTAIPIADTCGRAPGRSP